MIKKIIYLIISVAIVTTGVIGFTKLNYWSRSVSIFKVSSSEQTFGRGGPGSGRGEFGRGEGFRRELPDSVRQRFEREGRFPDGMNRQRADSSFSRGRGFNGQGMRGREFGDRRGESGREPGSGEFERGMGRGGEGRGEFRGGSKINLETVGWYLAVFAALAVVAIYIEKGIKFIRKKENNRDC
jgi:hypothetical protein